VIIVKCSLSSFKKVDMNLAHYIVVLAYYIMQLYYENIVVRTFEVNRCDVIIARCFSIASVSVQVVEKHQQGSTGFCCLRPEGSIAAVRFLGEGAPLHQQGVLRECCKLPSGV